MRSCRVFVDTNVFGYAVSRGVDEHKERVSVEATSALSDTGKAAISPQVIAEFLSVCRKSPLNWMSAAEAREMAAEFVSAFQVVPLDVATTREALRACDRYQLGYFDAQIWAAARMSGCDVILTEDTHGAEIEGVRYVDPFAEGFDVESLLRG